MTEVNSRIPMTEEEQREEAADSKLSVLDGAIPQLHKVYITEL